MMTDVYREQLVEKRPGGAATAKKILIVVAAILLSIAAFYFLYVMGILLAALIFYGGYYLLMGVDCEYEYIFTNGSLDIDKIIGKRSRKRLVSAECENFTSFGMLKNAPAAADGITTVLASDGTGEGEYYADFKHSSAGNVRLIFTPDEEMIKVITSAIPRPVLAEYKKNNDIIG